MRRRRGVFSCVLLILISPFALWGKPLAAYRKNVENARILVEDLIYSDAEEMSAGEFKEYERRATKEIRADLPPGERIEWRNSATEIDNRWLNEKLNEFERAAADSPKRAAVLNEIDERLGAIEQKLAELENSSAPVRAKDEDKQKLAEILRREEYQKSDEQKESLFERMWKKFTDWLAAMFPRPNIPDAPAGGFQSLSFVLQMLLYALVFGVIGFLIYRFAPFLAGKFNGRERVQTVERVILGERIAAEETAENLFDAAERLARAGDLRGAIRKGYIALLCDLSDRKIIGLARHKTNRDYLRDVRPKREIYENMNGLTARFERHWYGSGAVEEKDWEEFRNGYRETIKN